MPDPILTWTRTRPGEWHSGCGRYLILRGYLPGGMTVFNLRGLDHGCGPGGYFITERYGIGEIMQAAGTHAYAAEHGAERNVPPDFPALAMTRFFWPISGGTTRAALVITQAGGLTSTPRSTTPCGPWPASSGCAAGTTPTSPACTRKSTSPH